MALCPSFSRFCVLPISFRKPSQGGPTADNSKYLDFGLVCAYSAASMDVWLTIRSFLAIFFLLYGICLMAGVSDARGMLGAFLAALGLTFFWRLWVATRTGK